MRDALLGRQADYLDLDFVLPEHAVQIAKTIANHYKAGFVLLDAEHQIARVVFDRATVDFAQQVGPSLEVDLQRRDFTVNAIAYSPHTCELLDPLQGCADLQQRQIRMVAAENLKEDPLRLLRAYRQAAQLHFGLEAQTQAMVRQFAPLLGQVAAERVQGELNYLLSKAEGTPLLELAWHDGLFQAWLPDISTIGIEQVKALDQAAALLEQTYPDFAEVLKSWIRQPAMPTTTGRSWLRLAKLSRLLSADPQQAEAQLWHLKYSRAEVQAAIAVQQDFPRFMTALQADLSLRQQYELFQEIGLVFPALALLGIALGHPIDRVSPLIQRFLNPDDPVAHPAPLITGRELMKALHIPPGPKVGQLLEAIQIARAEGKVATAEDAIAWAMTHQTA